MEKRANNRGPNGAAGARTTAFAAAGLAAGLRWAVAALAVAAFTFLAGAAQAQSYVITTAAGQGTAGAFFGQPTGVAADSAGNLYVADASYCVIWKIAGGVATVFAGSEFNCGTFGQPAPAGVLAYPVDVAACGGNVYFVTHGYDPVPFQQSFAFAIPGAAYMADSSGNVTLLPLPSPPQAGAGRLFPTAIACDPSGDVFLSSYFYRSQDTGFFGTVDEIPAGSSTTMNLFVQFDTYIPGIAANQTTTSAITTTNVYALQLIALEGSNPSNPTPYPNNAFLYQVANGGATAVDAQYVPGGIPNPARVAVDGSGNFLITEAAQSGGTTVYVLSLPNPSGTTVAVIAGNGTLGYNGDNISATQAELNSPEGLAVDSAGDVYIADALNGRVRELRSVQAGPSTLQISAVLPLARFLGYQQYALNPATGDFFYVSSAGVNVLGKRLIASYETIEAVIPIGAGNPLLASSITLIADATRNLVYANNSADGNLYVIDGKTLAVIGSVPIKNPNASLLAIDPGLNQVYVAGPNSTAVSVVQGPSAANPPVLLGNIGSPAVFISSLGVDPSTHLVYGVCASCESFQEEGLITIDGAARTATINFLGVSETIAAPEFVGNSLAVDPATGSPIVAGVTSLIPNCSFCFYQAVDFASNLLSSKSVFSAFPPISVSLDARDRVFYVTDSDGVPSDPSSNVASVGGLDATQLTNPPVTVPLSYPIAAPTARVYDVEPDTGTFQAYVSSASQPAGSPAAPQGMVELWDGLSQQVTETVAIPNAGGGPLAVNSANHFVYLADDVNLLLYLINGLPLTPVASPQISPPGGPLLNLSIPVVIAGQAGDTIFYTLDGSAPQISPSSTSCVSPCSINVSPTPISFTLNAIRVVGGIASSVATGNFTLPQPTTTTVTVNPASTPGGFPVSATAMITPAIGSATGTVIFTDVPQGSSSPATTLCSSVSVASNQASCAFGLGTAGTYTITATYSGDAFNAPSSGTTTLVVTSSGAVITPVSIPYTSGLTPVALTTNNTGSASTYVLNSDTSVSVLQNGGLVTGGCPALSAFSGGTVTGGTIYFDPSSSRLYLAFSASSSVGQGVGISVTYETINPGGTCTPGAATQVTSFGSGNIELAVDPGQGNVYLLVATQGGTPDNLYVYSTSSLSLLSQNTLDYSASYGPLVLDSSTHRLYINDFGSVLNAPAGLNASPGFFVYDPNQTGLQLQHVVGYLPPASASATGQVLLSAEALLVDGKGNLIVVNQNPIPTNGTATNPLPKLSTPLTILNTNQFSFFANTLSATGFFCCSGAVDIEPGAAMSTISAVTSYTAMSAADIDATKGIVYGFTYNATAPSPFQITPTAGSGALFSYNLSTSAETGLAKGAVFAATEFGTTPWSRMTFDTPSQSLVLYASASGGTALAVSAPACPGATVPIEQVLGGAGISGAGPGAPAVNFTSGYIYDIQSGFPNTILYSIAQQPNPCVTAAPAPPPSITGVTPGSGPIAGGETVVIAGQNFLSGATVLFGSTPAASVTVNSATSISAVTPALGPGTASVTVTNPDGQSASLTGAFTAIAPPGIASVTPNVGLQGQQGLQVTVTGANFVTGATTVTFGQGAAGITVAAGSLVVNSPSSLTATLNIAQGTAAGSYDVVVSVNGALSTATLTGGFTVAVTINVPETISVTDAVTVTPLINVAAPVAFFSDGAVGFGGQSGNQSLTLSNIGLAPLMLVSATTSTGSPFSITQVTCSNGATSASTTLPSGGACTFTISYTASATPATDSDNLVFADGAALSNLTTTAAAPNFKQSIPLSGPGFTTAPPAPPLATIPIPTVPETITVSDQVYVTPLIGVVGVPAAAFSDSSLGFNSTVGAVQNLTVANVGQAPLLFFGTFSISPNFTVGPILCSDGTTAMPTALASGGQCTFPITFVGPSSSGGTITFTDNAALSSPAGTPAGANFVQTIQLNGTASSSVVIGPPSATVTIPTIFEPIKVTDTPVVPNTQGGTNVAVTPVDTTTGTTPVTLTFTNVTQPGITTLTTSPTGPAPPPGLQPGNPGVYYNLSTTAIYTGPVTICINYAGILFTQPPHLYHYQTGAWMDVTASVNTTTMIVCGTTTSFSPFALFQPSAFPTTTAISATGVSYGTAASVAVSVGSAGGTATGSVSLSVDGGAASTMPLSSGSATFSLGVLSAGSHALSASFAAQGNFLGSSARGTLFVGQVPLTVTANGSSRQYGGVDPAFTVSYSGFVNGDGPGSLSGKLTCTAVDTASSPVENYAINCSGLSSPNYAITYAPGTLMVTKAALTVTANNATKTLNAANPTLGWTASGFVNGENSSVLTATPMCTTTAATASPVGSYPINCSGANAANYSFTYVPGTLKILYAPNVGHVIQPPVNADGTSVFKQGRTIPAQFSVYDANGVSIGTPGVVASFFLTRIVSGTVTTTVDNVVDTNNPDTAFRWDPTGQQWIFNITTGNLYSGSTYIYTITLNDGSTIIFQYGLR